MESRLAADLGDVRLHVDAASTRALNASAFTTGEHIVFAPGAFQPATQEGRHRLVHELAHVVQQRAGRVDGQLMPGGFTLSSPGDHFEQAAVRVADGAAPTVAAPQSSGSGSGSPMAQVAQIQRDEATPGSWWARRRAALKDWWERYKEDAKKEIAAGMRGEPRQSMWEKPQPARQLRGRRSPPRTRPAPVKPEPDPNEGRSRAAREVLKFADRAWTKAGGNPSQKEVVNFDLGDAPAPVPAPIRRRKRRAPVPPPRTVTPVSDAEIELLPERQMTPEELERYEWALFFDEL